VQVEEDDDDLDGLLLWYAELSDPELLAGEDVKGSWVSLLDGTTDEVGGQTAWESVDRT
jgi:hypothetical protein